MAKTISNSRILIINTFPDRYMYYYVTLNSGNMSLYHYMGRIKNIRLGTHVNII